MTAHRVRAPRTGVERSSCVSPPRALPWRCSAPRRQPDRRRARGRGHPLLRTGSRSFAHRTGSSDMRPVDNPHGFQLRTAGRGGFSGRVPRRKRERTAGAPGRRFGARVVSGQRRRDAGVHQSDDACIVEASERTYCAPRHARSGRAASVRRRAIGARPAAASVEEQRIPPRFCCSSRLSRKSVQAAVAVTALEGMEFAARDGSRAPGRSGGRCGVAVELQEVVRRRDQSPFGPDGGSSVASEAVDGAVELGVGEHRLDDRLALAVELAAAPA